MLHKGLAKISRSRKFSGAGVSIRTHDPYLCQSRDTIEAFGSRAHHEAVIRRIKAIARIKPILAQTELDDLPG